MALDQKTLTLAAHGYASERERLTVELAISGRRLLEEAAGNGIFGGPIPGLITLKGAENLKARYAAAAAELIRSGKSRDLRYSMRLEDNLVEAFGIIIAADVAQIEQDVKGRLLPFAQMTGVIDDVRKILTVADASALAKARSDFEHYVAQLKAEGDRRAVSSRTIWMNRLFGFLSGGAVVALIGYIWSATHPLH